MRLLTQFGLVATLGSLSLLTGCQTGESGPDQAALEKKIEMSLESDKPENRPVQVGAAPTEPGGKDLERFQAKGPFADPMPMDSQTPSGTQAAPLAKKAAYGCTIGYNNKSAIGYMPNKAYDTFAYWPHYIETCEYSTYAYTLPLKRNHYHLAYENPWLCADFTTPAGKVGVYNKLPSRSAPKCEWSVGTCTTNNALDPANYPRYMHPHDYVEWVQIYVNRGGVRKTFDFKSLYIKPNTYAQDGCYPDAGKVQIWIKKAATQQWLYWKELLPGYVWSPYPADGAGLDEIQITSPAGWNWSVDDIKLSVTN